MTNFKDENIDDINKFVYIQKTENLDKRQIFHIIVGNDSFQEVKEKYNEPVIRFIRKTKK